jgi:hypothetical protein
LDVFDAAVPPSWLTGHHTGNFRPPSPLSSPISWSLVREESICVFLEREKLVENGKKGEYANLYAFCLNRPDSRTDPAVILFKPTVSFLYAHSFFCLSACCCYSLCCLLYPLPCIYFFSYVNRFNSCIFLIL